MLGTAEQVAYRSQQDAMGASMSNLRLNVQIKDNPGSRISLIAKSNCRIQQLKRRIERQFNELLQQQMIVSLIEDSHGFTLSNNSSIGEHVRSGDMLFVQLEQVDLGRRMNLGTDLQQNFVTLRYVSNSFCENLLSKRRVMQKRMYPKTCNQLTCYPSFCIWEVVLNVARTLNKLLSQDSVVEYYQTDENAIQKGLLLQLLQFWATEVQRNLNTTKQLLKELVAVLAKLCFTGAFVSAMKQHPLLKVLVALSKNQKVDVSFQKALLRLINAAARNGGNAGSNMRPGSNQSHSYVPSFIGDGRNTQYNSSDIEGTLNMLNAESIEVRKLGLSMLEKDMKEVVTECCVRSEYFEKLLKGILEFKVARDSQRAWLAVVAELTKRVSYERASQQISRPLLYRGVAQFLQESHPSLHGSIISLFQSMAERGNYLGDSTQAFQYINSPYRQFGQVCLRIVLTVSEPDNISDTLLRPYAQYARLLISMAQSEDVSAVARRYCLKILSNVLLNDDCRYEILNGQGFELFVRRMDGFDDVQSQRIAAKALLNISMSSRQNKLKVMTAIAHLIELMYKERLDRVVEGYLQTILKSRELHGKHY